MCCKRSVTELDVTTTSGSRVVERRPNVPRKRPAPLGNDSDGDAVTMTLVLNARSKPLLLAEEHLLPISNPSAEISEMYWKPGPPAH